MTGSWLLRWSVLLLWELALTAAHGRRGTVACIALALIIRRSVCINASNQYIYGFTLFALGFWSLARSC